VWTEEKVARILCGERQLEPATEISTSSLNASVRVPLLHTSTARRSRTVSGLSSAPHCPYSSTIMPIHSACNAVYFQCLSDNLHYAVFLLRGDEVCRTRLVIGCYATMTSAVGRAVSTIMNARVIQTVIVNFMCRLFFQLDIFIMSRIRKCPK
jgi:hypothetical protein